MTSNKTTEKKNTRQKKGKKGEKNNKIKKIKKPTSKQTSTNTKTKQYTR